MRIVDLREGMVLKKDLNSPFGDVLLKKGTVLNNTHIQFFKNWGLKELDVTFLPRNRKDSMERQIVMALKTLDQKFINYKTDPSMAQIKEELRQFMLNYLEEINKETKY